MYEKSGTDQSAGGDAVYYRTMAGKGPDTTVIHRDYSLTGKDIKIAILDDKIEITSPGKLLPSVDFNDMEAGQSDIRNKILAPVFKRLGIIEQWGNGLKIISAELQKYPEIGLDWKEPGIAFRVIFIKKNFRQQQELQQETLYTKILRIIIDKQLSKKEISIQLSQKAISGHLNEVISKLLAYRLIEWTIKNKPKSSKQKFIITNRGVEFLKLLK